MMNGKNENFYLRYFTTTIIYFRQDPVVQLIFVINSTVQTLCTLPYSTVIYNFLK